MSSPGDLMVSVSGVRGILGAGMNPEVAARYTAAFAADLSNGLVVIGRDSRPSGPLLADAAAAALRFRGVTVIDLGLAATPTVELMVRELGAAGGIIVTASHNGPAWNALKFLGPDGEFPPESAVERIRRLAAGSNPLFERFGAPGALVRNETGDAVHIRRILELSVVDRGRIASRAFRVVVDCVNGAGSRIVPALLRSLGVSVVELYTDVDSPFPHDPEPRPANLTELAAAVPREKADLGFAVDPDADRLVLVDGGGRILSEELTLALAADFVLQRERGPLVANLSSSRVLDDVAARHGVPLRRSKVGEANVIALMKEARAPIGGEGNGGVIYPAIHYGRDAMTGMALVLESLAESGRTLAEAAASLPAYEIVKEKFAFSGDLAGVAERLRIRFPGSCSTLDGMRIDMPGGWIHIRPSNTEPVVRVIAEAGTAGEAKRLVEEARSLF